MPRHRIPNILKRNTSPIDNQNDINNEVINIDLTQELSEENSILLDYLLKQTRTRGQYDLAPNNMYKVDIPDPNNPENQIEKIITLSHAIKHREKKLPNGRSVSRYSVVGAVIGKGAYGKVYEVLGTLAHHRKSGMRYTHKPRVIKEQLLKQNYYDRNALTLEEIKKEVKLLKLTQHAHVKEITINGRTAYIVTRQFKGVTLNTLLNNENSYPLSVDQRYQLTINLLRALKEQMHDNGIVHRDIKPHNIIVDPETLEVNIIDLGISRKASEPDDVACGTPTYVPPESERGELDETSDVYSMGLVISEVWKAIPRNGKTDFENIQLANQPQAFNNLFEDISTDELSTNNRNDLYQTLHLLTNVSKQSRPTLQSTIDQFEENLLQRKLQTINNVQEKTNLITANHIAKKAYEQLYEVQKKGTANPFEKILSIIDKSMQNISSPAALSEFLNILGIQAFNSLHNKAAINQVAKKITQDFENHLNQLLDLSEKGELINDTYRMYLNLFPQDQAAKSLLNELDELQEDIDILLYKESKRELKLDHWHELNQRFEKEIPALINRLNSAKINLTQTISNTPVLNNYYSIITKLNTDINAEDPIKELKLGIKKVIRDYLYTTFSEDNLKKQKRSASSMRQQDMNELLDVISNNNDYFTLHKEISKVLDKMQNTGFLITTSTLKNNVKKILEKPVVINTNELQKADYIILKQFLQDKKDNHKFEKNKIYAISIPDEINPKKRITFKFKLTNSISAENLINQINSTFKSLNANKHQLLLLQETTKEFTNQYSMLLNTFTNQDITNIKSTIADVLAEIQQLLDEKVVQVYDEDEFSNKVNNLTQKVLQLEQAILKLESNDLIGAYKKLYDALAQPLILNDSNRELKQAIKDYLKKYIDESLIKNTPEKNSLYSGVSPIVMMSLLNLVHDSNMHPDDFYNELNKRVNTRQPFGFFNDPFTADLQKIIEDHPPSYIKSHKIM